MLCISKGAQYLQFREPKAAMEHKCQVNHACGTIRAVLRHALYRLPTFPVKLFRNPSSCSERLALPLFPALILAMAEPQDPLHLPHTSADCLSRVCAQTHSLSCRCRVGLAGFLRVAFRRPFAVLFPSDDQRVDDVFQVYGDGRCEALDDDFAVDLGVGCWLYGGADGMVWWQYRRSNWNHGTRRGWGRGGGDGVVRARLSLGVCIGRFK